jgi:hypothetical protein
LTSKTSAGIFDGYDVDRKSDAIKMPRLPTPFTEKQIPELAVRPVRYKPGGGGKWHLIANAKVKEGQ